MSITLNQASDALLYFPRQDTPCFLSRPGVGKSKMVEATAARANAFLVNVYAVLRDAVDAKGLPTIQRTGKDVAIVEWAIPSEYPIVPLIEKFPQDQEVWLFLDDLFHAVDAVQKVFARAFFERIIGECDLLPNVRVVVASNRLEDRAGVMRSPTYVNDRLSFAEVAPNYEEYIQGAIHGFAKPEAEPDYMEKRKAIDANVAKGIPEWMLSYVKFTKTIDDFDPARRSNYGPRSVERASRIVRAFDAVNLNSDVLMELLSGTMSPEHANNAMAYRRMASEVPDIDALLRGENVPLPRKPEVLYMTALSVMRGASAQKPAATMPVARLIRRMADIKDDNDALIAVEIAAFVFGESLRAGSKLQRVMAEPDVQEFMKKHGRTVGV